MPEKSELTPRPKWNKNLKLQSLKIEKIGKARTFTTILAVIRTGINPNEFDENAYDGDYSQLSAEELFWQNSKGQTTDQILLLGSKNGLSGEVLTERTDLKYLNFLQELNVQDRIRHETIHPLIFDLTQEIFGKITDPFDYRMELVVGGFDWFLKNIMKDPGSVISFTFKGENEKTFYCLFFQLALAMTIKNSFYENSDYK